MDINQHAKEVVQILELAASMDEKLTPLKLVEAWMGKGPAKHRKMLKTTTLSRTQAEAVIVRLLLQGYLRSLVFLYSLYYDVDCFLRNAEFICIIPGLGIDGKYNKD